MWIDSFLKSLLGERYNPVSETKSVEVELVRCCGNQRISGNVGDILGFSVIRCNNCGTQISGKNIETAVDKWNKKIGEVN